MSAATHAECVLVIEDEPMNLELAVEVLELDGYSVRTATTAERGLELAALERPAVILMDLGLPGISGYEATQRLKADPVTAAIPVIALTAMVMKSDEFNARRAGCDAYLTKPLDGTTLCETVRRFIPGRPR